MSEISDDDDDDDDMNKSKSSILKYISNEQTGQHGNLILSCAIINEKPVNDSFYCKSITNPNHSVDSCH